MSNDVNELLRAAESGDVEAMFDLGRTFWKSGDVKQAIFWYEKATDKGDVTAATNLVLIYGDPGLSLGADGFLESLKKLAGLRDSWGMVKLGVLYCGLDNHLWANAFGAGRFTAHKNLAEGFRLIEEGVRIDKESKDGFPLGYEEFFDIATAYHAESQINKSGRHFSNDELPEAVGKNIEYMEKALAALNPPSYPEEVVKQLTANLEASIEAAKGKLESVKSALAYSEAKFKNT